MKSLLVLVTDNQKIMAIFISLVRMDTLRLFKDILEDPY